jgi:hypothetical protein
MIRGEEPLSHLNGEILLKSLSALMDGSLYKYTGMAHFMVKGYLSKLDISLRDEDWYRPRTT